MAYTNCESTIAPDERLCQATHCNQYQETSTMKRTCKCLTWDGKKIDGCEPKNDSFPVETYECYNSVTKERKNISADQCKALILQDPNWNWSKCFCCCSCYAWGVNIAISQTTVRVIQSFQIGDTVMAGSYDSGTQSFIWEDRVVEFSSGTAPTTIDPVFPDRNAQGSPMVQVNYGPEGSILVTTDHLFLMPDGKFKRADRLVPGDQLVMDNGQTIPVVELIMGTYTGGIHHIATPMDFDQPISPNGHLLSSNGVVSADYYLQSMQSADTMQGFFVANHDNLPVFGTEEYAAQGIEATLFHARAAGQPARAAFSDDFNAFGVSNTFLPADARPYLTSAQAIDILTNAPKRPFSDTSSINNINYLFKLFGGFYPDIHFYMDWENTQPNLYAFEMYGQKTVYVSGQLLRTKCLYINGLAAILSHGVAIFYGAPPAGPEGYACVGQADYFGIGYVLQQVYYTQSWSVIATPGVDEIQTLFSYITPENGKSGDSVCLRPSIACRIDALQAALMGAELPSCAGGPTPGGLHVDGAQYGIIEGTPSVTVQFNQPVSDFTAEQKRNYSITPESVIMTATVNVRNRSQVILTVELPVDTHDFVLNVQNVFAADGSTLNPDYSTANFFVP